jgi:phosphatidylserine decarboxylase
MAIEIDDLAPIRVGGLGPAAFVVRRERVRRLREGARPVADPGNDRVLVNACESAPYRIARDVQYRDRFWIKSQPYSIAHMLANDTFAPLFAGATVYQAYLSPLCYHRWHSPVSGTVKKAYLLEGTYFARRPRTALTRPARTTPRPTSPSSRHARRDVHRSR